MTEWKLSYDYEDLLTELKSDLREFDVKDDAYIYIVRDVTQIHTHFLVEGTKAYAPIIDYYLPQDAIEHDDEDKIEKQSVKSVLTEMQEMNEMF